MDQVNTATKQTAKAGAALRHPIEWTFQAGDEGGVGGPGGAALPALCPHGGPALRSRRNTANPKKGRTGRQGTTKKQVALLIYLNN